MLFNAKPGDTLLLPKPGQTTFHLWVVLTEQIENPRKTVIVNITTKRNHSDLTVVLDKGDHSFLSHPSVINFMDARFVKTNDLKKAVVSGCFRTHKSFNPTILKTIQEGLLRSHHTPKKIKEYCSSLF